MSGKRTILGYRVKDTGDDHVPYAVYANFGIGWAWLTRREARGRWMPRAVAVATLAKMRAWAKTPEGTRFRMWSPADLRLVRVVRKGGAS